MRQIRVTYRATFVQLICRMKCSAPINVELVETPRGWICRSPETGADFHFLACLTPEAAKAEAASRFLEMISDGWWIFGKPPDSSERRTIQEDEIRIRDGKAYWLDLNDFTHIVDPKRPMNGQSAKIHPAACGESPSIKQIISLKAYIEPSCPKCAEVYRGLKK